MKLVLENKKISIKILKILLLTSIILSNFSFAYPAKAEDPKTDTNKLSCDNLNPPGSNEAADAVKGKIITILEERINPEGTEPDGTFVKNCMRKTECTKDKGETTCRPLYVDNDECTPENGDKDTSQVICQPVQAIIASSGANLLYSYVGIIYKWAAGTVGIVTVLYMVFGGIEIATAGGSDEKLNKAKERITQSIAGLVLLFLSALILYTINPNFFVT